MKAAELREKTSEELTALEKQLRHDLFRLRLSHYGGEGEFGRVAEFKKLRRDIARIQTILTERKRQA